jgi:hypothetical protein
MSIDEAVISLMKHLGEEDVFTVRHDENYIIVDVNFIYRVKDVQNLGGMWEGFPVTTGRRSCW